MKERFIKAFEDTLAANRGGEVKNLLITDNDYEFLDDALYALRFWAVKNCINLVELDEKADSWLHEIRSRELYHKLNQPNTVLMIKNYSTVNFMREDDNTPGNFLRDAIMNRHYGCGNDFEPTDELPNLMFVVVINDLTEMSWRENEYSLFKILHDDDTKKVWTDTNYTHSRSKMHPVMSAVNKPEFWVSDDETTLCIDVDRAFKEIRSKHPVRAHHLTTDDKIEIVHAYIEDHLPDFHKNVTCLMLRTDRDEHFVIDGRRLRKSFPNFGSILCNDNVEIAYASRALSILDPFALGETSFYLALNGDIPMANSFVRDLWALDHKWARFFREVALDFQLPCDEHLKHHPDINIGNTGLDKLFRIYLFGWYFKSGSPGSFNEDCKVHVKKHQSFEKAMDLLAVRFKNWGPCHISEKLRWDLSHCAHDADFKYETFAKVICETERLFPGTLDQLQKDGMEEDEVLRLRALMTDESKT